MRFYSRFLFSGLLFFCLWHFTARAQTLTITNFDTSLPYTAGSSITVPFHIDYTTGCFAQNNVFSLYITDAAGTLINNNAIATATGFYATYINANIPVGAGVYRFKIVGSNPSVSVLSNPITVVAGGAVNAAITPQSNSAQLTAGVFGKCDNAGTTFQFDYNNASTAGATGSVTIVNESTAATTTNNGLSGSYTAGQTNYTLIVKATNGTSYGTRAYTLLNNIVNSNLGSSNNTSACITATNNTVDISYLIDVSQLQQNFPGNTYRITWGDGGPASTYTICDIIAAGNKITHTYTKSSCGTTPIASQKNKFEVDFQPLSPYCGTIGNVTTGYTKISLAPTNKVTSPSNGVACAGPVTFNNNSYPGEDPNSGTNNCVDFPDAKYSWYIDADQAPTLSGASRTTPFTPTLTSGNHTIRLHLENNPTACDVFDFTYNICVQANPIPKFTLSSNHFCATDGTTITNTSVIDQTCAPPVYNWSVAGPAAVTTTGGTTVNSAEPKFVFTAAGIYTITLSMPTICGTTVTPVSQRVVVDNTPGVTRAADAAFCGTQTLTFNATAGSPTRVIYSGSGDYTTDTYQWTITPAGGAVAATFAGGTSATSQYPQISFPGYGSYAVTVTFTDACGQTSATQNITIQQAPAVSAGPDASICASSGTYQLSGSITPATNVSSYRWVTSGDGIFDNATGTLTPVYTLGTNDRRGGAIRLTLDVKTTLTGACADVQQFMTLTVTSSVTVSSSPTAAVCSGNALNYRITSATAGAAYTWTATAPGTITGFTASGSGSVISDVLTNSDPANAAAVTYTINPAANGCSGTPFTLTVTVNPNPAVTVADVPSLCSGKPAGVQLQSGLKYTWTAVLVSGTANGFTQQSAPVGATAIVDILNNTGTTQAVVKYTITPISSSGCSGTPVSASVTIEAPPTQPADMPAAAVCSATSYKLNGTVPVVGTGQWAETSGKTVSFADASDPGTVVSGLTAGTVYNFSWTISTPCASNSKPFQLTDNLPSVGGTSATAANPVCYGSNGSVTISGYTGTVTFWQRSTDGGATWTTIPASASATYSYTGLTQTTSYRAGVTSGSCAIDYSTPVTITVIPATVVPDAGPDQNLCNQNNTSLKANDPGSSTGLWTQKSGPAATITNPTSPATTVTLLAGGNNYTFTWTVKGQPPCGDLSDDIVITDQAPIINTISIAGSGIVCAGTSTNITGSTPTGGLAPFSYVWESSIDNGATWVVINGQTAQSITVTTFVNTQFRRTVYSAGQSCNSISNVITITTQAAVGNNTISSTSGTICYNTAPNALLGSQPTGGDGVYFYRWQQSINGGATFTDIANATGQDYQPPALTATTIYRRVVSTSLCSGTQGNTSNTLTITVTPALNAFFTAKSVSGCAPFNITSANITANADPNAQSYSWYADGILIGTGITFPGYTITNDGVTVPVKLVLTSKVDCPDASYSLDFNTNKQAVASFTVDKTSGCGPQTVTFTNTSSSLTGTTFTWSFGDGSANYTGVTPPPHTFQPDDRGIDITYKISLNAGGCAPTTATQLVTIYPAKPVPVIDPGPASGCSPYAITVKNITAGTNATYDFYLYDDTNTQVQKISKTDKSDAVFNAINAANTTRIYTVYMIATNFCGATNKSVVYPITIAPSGLTARMNITPVDFAGKSAGCAPFLATFHNLSTGGSGYVYNIYDSNFQIIESIINNTQNGTQNYSFAKAGIYYVSIGVYSNCSTGLESAKTQVTVYPLPAPDFAPDVSSACTQLTVHFKNNTPGDVNSPANSYTYTWDFGDGTTSNDFAPIHVYKAGVTPYNVKLTAVNGNGCSATALKAGLINVYPPPGTDFTAQPDTITAIPNYTFAFIDKSAVTPVSWLWDFGDKTTSTRQNPSHTYADTGTYKVTLTASTQYGCTDSKTHIVKITGVPGQLYVPNAFMPSSLTPELRTFTIKGSGIKQWTMRIFNNWGQLIFETTKLSSRGEPIEFWDGRFNGKDSLQGVYAWEISALFINGTDWKGMSYNGSTPKKAGTLNLIR